MGNSKFGAVVLACTREHDWEQPAPGLARLIGVADDPRLVDHACIHGVEACVHLSLRSVNGVGHETRSQLEQAYFVALRSHALAIRDLAVAAEAFDDAGLSWLAFKGPVLAEHVYRRADLRSYGDLDLLVRPADLSLAVAALESAGGQLLDRNWSMVLKHMRGQLHVRLPAGTTVDLHWDLLNDVASRQVFPVDVNDLIDRRNTVEIGESAIPTLCVEDTVVHLALHACTSGGNRLIGYKDLEQAVAQLPIDWDAVIRRAREWRAGQAAAVMLVVASRAFDFDVDRDVIRALSPGPAWRRLARLADRLSPVENWNGGDSLIRDLCRSTRGDERASISALARRVASFAKARRRVGPHKVDRDPTSPRSLLYPGGDDADRAAYFTAVEDSAPDA